MKLNWAVIDDPWWRRRQFRHVVPSSLLKYSTVHTPQIHKLPQLPAFILSILADSWGAVTVFIGDE
jgi:hypothetical protein